MRLTLTIISVLIAAVMASCGHQADTAVPRRTAYPRMAEYDSLYVMIDTLPLSIAVNAGAKISTEIKADGAHWVTIRYPRYHAAIYATITPVTAAEAEAVIDNRTERMHRNIAGAQAEIIESENTHGYYSVQVNTPTVLTTPVQFLSVNHNGPRYILSGTAFFENAAQTVSADSLRPAIKVLERDVALMLKSVSEQ